MPYLFHYVSLARISKLIIKRSNKMIYFKTRQLARNFAAKGGKKVIDCGKDATKRWAVKVI